MKEDAEDCGANLQIGAGRDMRNARALLDKQVGSAESGGAASEAASPASNVGDVAPARLASTTLWTFKPHLALPPPPDAINQGGGASTSVTTAEGDPTAVERMMREAGVTQGILKRVTWRRRITGKRGILGNLAAATKTPTAAREEHRPSGKAIRHMGASKGGTSSAKNKRGRVAAAAVRMGGPLGCSKCRYLRNGCSACRMLGGWRAMRVRPATRK